MTKYQRIVVRTMVKTIDDLVQDGSMMLGGAGKGVEVDEAYFTVETYGRGRTPSKKVWILGMVEVDAPIAEVTDSNTRRAVRRHRDLQLQRRPRGAKKARVRIRQDDRIVDSPFEPSQERFVVEEAGEEEVVRLTVPPEDADEGDEVAERLARLNRLYQQERGEEPRKALFF